MKTLKREILIMAFCLCLLSGEIQAQRIMKMGLVADSSASFKYPDSSVSGLLVNRNSTSSSDKNSVFRTDLLQWLQILSISFLPGIICLLEKKDQILKTHFYNA
jgi:hypothetical protein